MVKTAKRPPLPPLPPLQIVGLLAFSIVVGYPAWIGLGNEMWGASSSSSGTLLFLLRLLAAVAALLIAVSDGFHQPVKSLKDDMPHRRDDSR
jgi:hypothetical protein